MALRGMQKTQTSRKASACNAGMPVLPAHIQAPRRVANAFQSGSSFSGAAVRQSALRVTGNSKRALTTVAAIIKDGAPLDRKLRVAVIGGGPSGACAAETLAKNGIETFLFERKLDNCKVSGTGGSTDLGTTLWLATHKVLLARVVAWCCMMD